jgi:hypothetical protein
VGGGSRPRLSEGNEVKSMLSSGQEKDMDWIYRLAKDVLVGETGYIG